MRQRDEPEREIPLAIVGEMMWRLGAESPTSATRLLPSSVPQITIGISLPTHPRSSCTPDPALWNGRAGATPPSP